MMKYIRYFFYAFFGILILFMAFNNFQTVEFVIIPSYFPFLPEWRVSLPLFVIVITALLIGLVLGYFGEYLREHRIRRERSKAERELRKKEAELDKLKKKTGAYDDEVLALLD